MSYRNLDDVSNLKAVVTLRKAIGLPLADFKVVRHPGHDRYDGLYVVFAGRGPDGKWRRLVIEVFADLDRRLGVTMR